MGYEKIVTLDAKVVIALGKKDKSTGKSYPKQVEGYYLGSRETENKRGKSALHFFLFGSEDPRLIAEFKQLKVSIGETVGVWGTTDLNRQLGRLALGTMSRVTSTGTKPTPNGDMYTYDVEKDSKNIIEVSAATSEISEDTEDTAEDDADEGYVSERSEEEVETSAAMVAQQAERKAKVQALFNKGKKA